MALNWPLDAFLGYLDTWSGVRQAERALGRSPIPDLRASLAPLWGAADTVRPIRWPLTVRLGVVAG